MNKQSWAGKFIPLRNPPQAPPRISRVLFGHSLLRGGSATRIPVYFDDILSDRVEVPLIKEQFNVSQAIIDREYLVIDKTGG